MECSYSSGHLSVIHLYTLSTLIVVPVKKPAMPKSMMQIFLVSMRYHFFLEISSS